MLTAINFAIFGWLLLGVAVRKRRLLHATMMTLGFGLDIGLLLYVELNRHAIAQAMQAPGALLVVHILIAVGVIALYPVLMFTGGQTLACRPVNRHRALALAFLALRLALAVTAWMVAK